MATQQTNTYTLCTELTHTVHRAQCTDLTHALELTVYTELSRTVQSSYTCPECTVHQHTVHRAHTHCIELRVSTYIYSSYLYVCTDRGNCV